MLVNGNFRPGFGVAASGDFVYAPSSGLEIYCVNGPRLTALLLGNQLVLKWAESAGDYRLESAANVTSPQCLGVAGRPNRMALTK